MKRSVYNFYKRFIDIIIAVLGLAVLSPLLAAIAIAVRINMGSPVLFRQPRPGINGRIFLICKFRTMKDEYKNGHLKPDKERLTPLGFFLRKFSLDELPELLNVLKGEMSIVGPRPLKVEYLSRYSPEQARRHEVRPGITGWAQINGRNLLNWEDKFRLDVWYLEHRSLWLDMRIIIKTFIIVFRHNDVNAVGHATMPEFLGNREMGG
jgi:sugar transferase EpsL